VNLRVDAEIHKQMGEVFQSHPAMYTKRSFMFIIRFSLWTSV